MALLIPVVTPATSSTGIEIGISPTAIFSESIDEGSILPTTCFLAAVKHGTSTSDLLIPPNSIQNVITASVVAERWHLTLDQSVTTADYGSLVDVNKGKKYRTKITINPDKPLDINTNYLVILSKDLTKTTVFDAELTVGSGTGVIATKGVFKALVDDTYTITITNTGVNNSARFTWTRESDAFTSNTLDAKDRFVEIDQGVKVKFGEGSFVAGNTYRIRTIVANPLNDFFAWIFSTGATNFELPEDENSDALINLPATGSEFLGSIPLATNPNFYVTKITPSTGQSLVPAFGEEAHITIQHMFFQANERGRAGNEYSIELLEGGTAGNEIVALASPTEITITIEDGVSTEQEVVDAFNASALVNDDFTAETSEGTIAVDAKSRTYFNSGEEDLVITIEFNKNINPATVTKPRMKLIAESLIPGIPPEEVRYDFEVVDNTIIITPV